MHGTMIDPTAIALAYAVAGYVLWTAGIVIGLLGFALLASRFYRLDRDNAEWLAANLPAPVKVIAHGWIFYGALLAIAAVVGMVSLYG